MKAISGEVIPRYWVSYFREYFRGMVHDELLETFDASKASGANRASIARKLDRRPEQITRWLSAPSNLEMDTISDLALSMGCVPKLTFESLDGVVRSHNGEQEAAMDVPPPATTASKASIVRAEKVEA